MRVLNWLLVGTLLVLGASFLGVHQQQSQPNTCEMTYMFPSYDKQLIPDAEAISARYQTFLYQEEGDKGTAHPNRSGWPALFMPGNAGCFRQGRSIASETARQASRMLEAATNGCVTQRRRLIGVCRDARPRLLTAPS